MLRRLGNKKKLLPVLLAHFPEKIHLFIDLFCGTASVTRAMVGKAPYIIANDIDADVFNLYQVVRHRKEELIDAMRQMPIHDRLFQYWRKNTESDPVYQAVRFLFLSNFGFAGTMNALKIGNETSKTVLIDEIHFFLSRPKPCNGSAPILGRR